MSSSREMSIAGEEGLRFQEVVNSRVDLVWRLVEAVVLRTLYYCNVL